MRSLVDQAYDLAYDHTEGYAGDFRLVLELQPRLSRPSFWNIIRITCLCFCMSLLVLFDVCGMLVLW